MRRSRAFVVASLTALGGGALAGCGQARQDAHEPRGNFPVAIVHADFPPSQPIASTHHFVLVVKNTGRKTVPDLAVTVDHFSYSDAQPGLAGDQRPVWIVDTGPGPSPSRSVDNMGPDTQGGYITAYTDTWAAGPVPAGRTVTFKWKVTAVMSGTHTVHYRVAAGLNGKARAVLAGGGIPQGSFTVSVTQAPQAVHVDPNTGQVVSGPPPQGSQ